MYLISRERRQAVVQGTSTMKMIVILDKGADKDAAYATAKPLQPSPGFPSLIGEKAGSSKLPLKSNRNKVRPKRLVVVDGAYH